MGYFDLYGNSYATRREALNAEEAQCAAIDADIANRKVRELEKKIDNMSHPNPLEFELSHIWSYINALEERIKYLESITKHLNLG